MRRYEIISGLLKGKNNIIGAEIGVCTGEFSEYMLSHHLDLVLFCIDPYIMYQSHYNTDNTGARQHHHQTQKDFDREYDQTVRRLSRFGERVILWRQTSLIAYKKITDRSLDFVFIDGNHLREYVAMDIVSWSPKVKIGGIIAGHDYNKEDPHHSENTCAVVDELFSKHDVSFGSDSCWWVIK